MSTPAPCTGRSRCWLLDQGIDPADASRVARLVSDPATAPTIEVVTDPDEPRVCVNGVDVTDRIRDADVTAEVSAVSAVAEVRTMLVAIQRRVAERRRGRARGP